MTDREMVQDLAELIREWVGKHGAAYTSTHTAEYAAEAAVAVLKSGNELYELGESDEGEAMRGCEPAPGSACTVPPLAGPEVRGQPRMTDVQTARTGK